MKRVFKERTFLILAVLTSVLAWDYVSHRVSFYFINKELFPGATWCLFALMVAAFVVEILAFCFFDKMKRKALKGIFICGCVMGGITFIIGIVFAVMGWEMQGDFFHYHLQALPYLLLIWFGIITCIVFPKKQVKRVCALVLAAVFTVCIVLAGFVPLRFAFAALPTVFAAGEGKYSIVWATTCNSTGRVEIQKGGVTHTFYDEVAGNLRSNDKVHHITVPSELLDESDSYIVKSGLVKERTGYTSWQGKEIASEAFRFRAVAEDAQNLTIWVLTDWHEHPQLALEATEGFAAPDILIMGGDALNEADSQSALVRWLLSPCAQASGSEVPVIFAKGNHECRGNYATEIQKDLGLENFYFTYRLGAVSGVVLDMGECYADDFEEYMGFADFESYRDKQESWLNNVTLPQARYHISICHDELFEEGREGRIKRAGIPAKLGELGTDLLVSGHEHESVYHPSGENGRTFPTFVAGGGLKHKTFTAGLIQIDGKQVQLRTVNGKGEEILKESFTIQ